MLGRYTRSVHWVSTLGRHTGSVRWVGTQGQHAGLVHWVSTLGQHTGSASWVATLDQHTRSAHWVGTLGLWLDSLPKPAARSLPELYSISEAGTRIGNSIVPLWGSSTKDISKGLLGRAVSGADSAIFLTTRGIGFGLHLDGRDIDGSCSCDSLLDLKTGVMALMMVGGQFSDFGG
jgi:hypothetical protein